MKRQCHFSVKINMEKTIKHWQHRPLHAAIFTEIKSDTPPPEITRTVMEIGFFSP